jgi:hypothetical protein
MDGGGGQHSVFAICFNYNVLTHDMLGRMVPRRSRSALLPCTISN